MKGRVILLTAVLFITAGTSLFGQNVNRLDNDIVIEDFETWPLLRWSFTGDAFSPEKPDAMVQDSWNDKGYLWYGYVSSFLKYDAGVGEMLSYPFVIERNYINFLLAGGNYEDKTYAALVIDGREVARTSGLNNRRLEWNSWNVRDYIGKEARIKLVDKYQSYFGFITADHFVQSDNVYCTPKTELTIKIKRKYLFVPLNNEAPTVRLNIRENDKLCYEFSLPLDGKNTKYWAPLCVPEFVGKELSFETEDTEIAKLALAQIKQGKRKDAFLNTFGEQWRPVFHFTSRVGHLNDPNGIYYLNGKWHLFYQHNPFGTSAGNTSWGHAVSSDLVHWKELDEIMYPDEYGLVYSGSAMFRDDTIYQFYTYGAGYTRASEGKSHTQGVAISTDNGASWHKQGIVNVPRMSKDQRDPLVFWHPESGHWCMVLFVYKYEFAILVSDDLMNWTVSDRFYVEGGEECPDLFKLKVEEDQEKEKWVFICANSTYMIGEFDGYRFYPQTKAKKIDQGRYYAAKTYINAPDERRILMAWLSGTEYKDCAFNNAIAFPRDITLHKSADGLYELWSLPVRELDNCVKPVFKDKNVTVDSGKSIQWEMKSAAFRMTVSMKENIGFGWRIDFDGTEYRIPSGTRTMTILSDKGTLEIFLDGGKASHHLVTALRTGKSKISLMSESETGTIESIIFEKIK